MCFCLYLHSLHSIASVSVSFYVTGPRPSPLTSMCIKLRKKEAKSAATIVAIEEWNFAAHVLWFRFTPQWMADCMSPSPPPPPSATWRNAVYFPNKWMYWQRQQQQQQHENRLCVHCPYKYAVDADCVCCLCWNTIFYTLSWAVQSSSSSFLSSAAALAMNIDGHHCRIWTMKFKWSTNCFSHIARVPLATSSASRCTASEIDHREVYVVTTFGHSLPTFDLFIRIWALVVHWDRHIIDSLLSCCAFSNFLVPKSSSSSMRWIANGISFSRAKLSETFIRTFDRQTIGPNDMSWIQSISNKLT